MKKKIERFEDLYSWQSARILVKEIYNISDQGKLAKDWGMKDQIRRASLSIMNNIAEGFDRFSNKDKIRFFGIASSSCSEVRSMLYILNDLNYLEREKLNFLFNQVTDTQKLIRGFIRGLNNQ